MNQLQISGSVGLNGKNNYNDIKAIQTALNKLIRLIPPTKNLSVDGSLGSRPEMSKTVAAITLFQQKVVGMLRPDGRVDVNGKSHQIINQKLKSAILPINLNQKAPWMTTAYNEIGQSEVAGKKANPQIIEYFKASKFWGTDDSGASNAWCASFVAWVMKQNGHAEVESAFRAKSWSNFGKKIDSPIYGAIGIKTRRGGGHVAFVVGKSADNGHLYMLGGNQGDRVQIKRYPLNVWSAFVVPSSFNTDEMTLPVYTKPAANAGRED